MTIVVKVTELAKSDHFAKSDSKALVASFSAGAVDARGHCVTEGSMYDRGE